MSKIFLDANYLIDIIEKRTSFSIDQIKSSEFFISPLSIHILFYIKKYSVPQEHISAFISQCLVVAFDDDILTNALLGGTKDFEDNVQLHSATRAECDYFLTRDKKLLDTKFFGKMRIVDSL